MTRSPARTTASLDGSRLRRLILQRQGLTHQRPFGRGPGATRRAVEHLGYVQIDTISVVERAHHHVLASRNEDHCERYLDQVIARRELFEYWFHAAALLPIAHYRFALPRMLAARAKRHPGRSARERKLESYVLQRIEAEGPLAAKDFEGRGGGSGWWDWKPAKRALEQLFYEGTLMIAGRSGFQKRFELATKALPENTDRRPPSKAEEADHLIDQGLRSVGYTTIPEATYLRRNAALREQVGEALRRRAASGEVLALQQPDGRALWVDTEGYEARKRPLAREVKILSPFDNVCIQRRRLLDFFAFDYQLECYLPAKKRRWGYYTLPLLLGERFLGRLDAKHDRAAATLRCHALHFEATSLADGPNSDTLAALGRSLARYASRQGARQIRLPNAITDLTKRQVRVLRQQLEAELERA